MIEPGTGQGLAVDEYLGLFRHPPQNVEAGQSGLEVGHCLGTAHTHEAVVLAAEESLLQGR